MRNTLIAAIVAFAALPVAAIEKNADKPSLNVALLEASTHPDTRWFGEKAYLFRADGVTAKNLAGHTITWTLEVRRKLADWKTAKSWLLTKQKVTDDQMPQITFGLIYRNLAKMKFQPGEHVAAFVAKDETGKQLYRGEVSFMLPATGPNAYNPRDFK